MIHVKCNYFCDDCAEPNGATNEIDDEFDIPIYCSNCNKFLENNLSDIGYLKLIYLLRRDLNNNRHLFEFYKHDILPSGDIFSAEHDLDVEKAVLEPHWRA